MSEIIDAANRFGKKPPPEAIDLVRLLSAQYTAAKDEPMKNLPFVSTKWHSDYWPAKMWVDVPTNRYSDDIARGEEFAKLTLRAMLAERHDRALELIFEDMVQECARRRVKGGKGAHGLPGAVVGYLRGLAKFIGDRV